jgi:pyruvate dehydrogenase E1 component
MNLFILLSALGLSHAINGERLLPIGTLYDPFIARGLDALNYACYQDARFMVVGDAVRASRWRRKAARISRSPTPLIGMAQDGLASFEPAFVDELAVMGVADYSSAPVGEASATGCATRPAARSICGCRPGPRAAAAR